MFVDCDGVLSLWVCGSVSEEGESVERGRAAGGGELIWLGLILRDPFQQQSSQFPRRDGVGGHRRVGLDLELLYENRGQSVLKLLLLFGCELGCDSADLLQHRFSDSF